MRPPSLYQIVTLLLCSLGAAACLNACGDSTRPPITPFSPDTCSSVYGPLPSFHLSPTWSSLGVIAYRDNGIACIDTGGIYGVAPDSVGIWTLDLSTGTAQRILSDGYTPDWSPNGMRLAFERNWDLYAANSDGSNVTLIVSEGVSLAPRWSPDGHLIAFHSSAGVPTHFATWIARADGSARRRIAEDGRCASWSPDQKSLVFIGGAGPLAGSPSGIVEYRLADGTFHVLLAAETGLLSPPRYSPDGTKIAFGLRERLACHPFQLWVMDADGKNPQRLTEEGGAEPAWSPDGTRIAFVRANPWDEGSGSGLLWVIDPDTRVSKQVTWQLTPVCD